MAFAGFVRRHLGRLVDQPRFLLNVPLFGREPLHPDVDGLVGDFTSSLLLDIDLAGRGHAASRAHVPCRTPCGPRPHTPRIRAFRCCAIWAATAARRCWRRSCSPARWGSANCSLPQDVTELRHARLDHLAGPAGSARRTGHRIRRRRPGELGRPRGRLPGRCDRRDVRASRRRTAIGSPPPTRLGDRRDPPALPADQRAVRDAVNSRRCRAQRRSVARRVLSRAPTPAGRAGGVRELR